MKKCFCFLFAYFDLINFLYSLYNYITTFLERVQLRQGAHHCAVRDGEERHSRGEPDQVVYARTDRTQGAGHDP